MMRFLGAAALAACALCTAVPAAAATPPPLPRPAASFEAGSMHVDVYGASGKPALIFIPGLACGPWEWSREIAQFSPNYTVYALTLPGFDGQPAIRSATPFETVTHDVWTMLQTHAIVKPIVVGHSLGGTLAIMLGEQHADRLAAIAAVDGLPVFPGSESSTPAQRAAAAAQMRAMMSSVTSQQQFEQAESAFVLPRLMTSPADVAAAAPLAAQSDPAATGTWAAEDTTLDLRADLKAVTVPLLEIAPYDPQMQGASFKDAAAVKGYYASLLAGAPHADVDVIAPSRHFIMYDQPQQLDAALQRFVSNE